MPVRRRIHVDDDGSDENGGVMQAAETVVVKDEVFDQALSAAELHAKNMKDKLRISNEMRDKKRADR